jgi:hypothetical protein
MIRHQAVTIPLATIALIALSRRSSREDARSAPVIRDALESAAAILPLASVPNVSYPPCPSPDALDQEICTAAFINLGGILENGHPLTSDDRTHGFLFRGERIPLINSGCGKLKPKAMRHFQIGAARRATR